MSRKYGYRRLDSKENFVLSSIDIDTLRVFDKNSNGEIDYKLKCNLINKTNKVITSADINGKLKVIFKDKTITGSSTYYSGFKIPISKSRPWNPNTEREIEITTKSIERLYLNYKPEYVFFELELKASDPVGYEYNRNILEKDLLPEWKSRQTKIEEPRLRKKYQTIERVSMYDSPSIKSKKLGSLPKGAVVGGVALVDSEWIKVKATNAEGYVLIKQLKEKEKK